MNNTKPKPLPEKRKRSRSRSLSPPRQRKRPGASSRITAAEKDAQQRRQLEREREQTAAGRKAAAERGIQESVTTHYNDLQQRDRGWRATESKIKNLRSYNNWAKSTLIQRFSPDEDFKPRRGGAPPPYMNKGLMVLDLGCGKGGDLQKWQKAPQRVERYVGVDAAEVSIQQARGRYAEMKQKSQRALSAEFHVKDAFGEPLGDLLIVRNIAEREGDARWGGGGFDVVSMMFCMHYAFESESKARGMLRNVAGALKKGGRFLGVIPNSDFIREKVEGFYEAQAAKKAASTNTSSQDIGDEADKNKPGATNDDQKDNSDKAPKQSNADEVKVAHSDEKPDSPPEWGNELYRIRFSGPVPKDGIFRPPFGWKYNYFLEEAVEEVPEYIVPWEAFRALAEDYNLEMQYRKPLPEIWNEERNDPNLGDLSVRMRVTDRIGGELQLTPEELEAVGLYHAFCFYKV